MNSKLDITTIILTYNEELHIRRCLENVCPFSEKVYVVDSFSTDRTCEICADFPEVEVVMHEWPGNQALQYNWALDNLPIATEWTMRIDADEYYLPELVEEMRRKLPSLPADVTGIEFKRRLIFMGRWMKHGIYPVVMLRMCRTGKGRYEERLMDEHYTLSEGRSIVMENDICDHSLINVSDYCRKHLGYAQREAAEVLCEKYGIRTECFDGGLGAQAEGKRKIKRWYNRLPLFWRSAAYLCYRYILKGGFLDGKEGFLFAFIQGWWYRTMVDAKVLECRKACGEDKEKIKEFILKQWNIRL